MIDIGITGGETIIAGELVSLLINHPDVNIKWVSSHSEHGKLSRIHKGLTGECDLEFSNPDFENVELAFNNLSTDDQDYLLEVYQDEQFLDNYLNELDNDESI